MILGTHFLDTTFGAFLIGAFGASALWGMSCVQFYRYMTTSGSKDRPWLRTMVVIVMLISTFRAVLIFHTPYYYLVTQYGKPFTITRAVWSLAIFNAVSQSLNFAVRLLYARHAWLLSNRNIWPTFAIVSLSIASLCLGISLTVVFFIEPNVVRIHLSNEFRSVRHVVTASFTIAIAGEASVTSTMCYYLYRSRTGFWQSNSIIAVLIKYTVTTGLIVTINATIALIMYYRFPSTNLPTMFYYLQTKMYVCCYLSLLNTRESLRERDHVHMNTSDFRVTMESSPKSSTSSDTRHASISTEKTMDESPNVV